MYIMTEVYDADPKVRILNIQSQLRMGSCDFEQNYYHVEKMLTCLDNMFGSYTQVPLPCSG